MNKKRQITDEEIHKARDVDITSLLESNGFILKAKGRTSVCSSPFSSDSTPSFVVYTDQNRFYDFSTGRYGDAITLAQNLLGIEFLEAVNMLNGTEMLMWDEEKYEKKAKKKKPFNIDNYTTRYEHEIKAIDDYARIRGITRNYLHGFFAKKIGGLWRRFPSIMFPHEDADRNITGAKFRNIQPVYQFDRFSARGRLGYYIIDEALYESGLKPDLYVCESETSANSLSEFMEYSNRAAVVISFGGVGTVPKVIPEVYRNLDMKIIIDYDGREEIYQERLKAYEHLQGTPVKLVLPKNEDINSLWANGELEILNDMLLTNKNYD